MTIETEPQLPAANVDTTSTVDAGGGAATTSIEDTIRAAYRAQSTKATATELADAQHDAHEDAADKGRQRGPDGKFAPKAKEAATGAEASDGEVGEEGADETTDTTAAQPKPHDVAPNTWKKEVAAEFNKLPESVRQEIHRREQDFHRGVEQYKGWANVGQMLDKEIRPYEAMIKQANTNAPTVIKSLLSMQHQMISGTPQEKTALLMQIATDYGIDLSSVTGQPPQEGQSTVQADPRIAVALQRMDKLESHLTTQERQRAEAEFSAKVEEVTKFGSDPKHEHYEAVREDMAALIEAGRASDLQDAYDKAIWAHPDVRAKLLAKQDQERARKQADEAAAARKAAGANVTRRGTPPVPATPGKMEDTIRSEYRRLNGGG